ncbi:MAG: VPLPA-CTERM sorting domain-containing protein [Tropicimonas sp.]|uniref:VPLPA-CTERM sorting domain-containing protein n=1 Tax=Tropicimonas sp. TaxID=2067044 RepID=UPI003A89542A
MRKLTILTGIAALACASIADAAPVTLEGMNQIKSWTDNEGVAAEMPDNIWGNADTEGYDDIGIYVEFANVAGSRYSGAVGSIVFSGVGDHWNTGTWSDIFSANWSDVTVTATGFFEAYAGTPFALNNITASETATAGSGTASIAFGTMYNGKPRYIRMEHGRDFGMIAGGWGSVTITTYGGRDDTNLTAVPLPATGLLLAGAFGGLAALRRRRTND